MNGSVSQPLLLAIYCGLVILASLAGGWIPLLVRLTHTRLQVAISFVAGLMLGVGLLHMLPHALHQVHSIDRTVIWLLAGFLVMFFAQRFFHFHHHDVPEEEQENAPAHPHDEHEHHGHTLAEQSAQRLSWTGAAFGLTLHSLIDGIALAASVEAEPAGQGGWLRGFGTMLVILMHKPFDAMAISTLMKAGGRSKYSSHVVNGLFALAIPAGVLLFHIGAAQYSGAASQFLGAALAFTAGTFLCISTSDLLPEIQFHTHDRFKLSFALLAGLGFAALIGQFESSGHPHQLGDDAAPAQIERTDGRQP
jgi:zinc and cadmium transporter